MSRPQGDAATSFDVHFFSSGRNLNSLFQPISPFPMSFFNFLSPKVVLKSLTINFEFLMIAGFKCYCPKFCA